MNKSFVQGILFSLCELILCIKCETILNYLNKTNVCIYILKVVFCEYANFLNPEFFKFSEVLIKLLEEGIDSLDNITLITTHQIVRYFI